VDFSNQNTSRIDELPGRYNPNVDNYTAMKDTIWKHLKELGRPTLYHHTINANYMVPINKLPLLDWTSLSARYQGMYDWQVGPINNTVKLGNVIENSRQIQLNGQLNLVTLYDKVGYLKVLNQKYGTSSKQLQRNNKPKHGQANG